MMDRRRFLQRLTVASTAVALGIRPTGARADPPPETTRLRLLKTASECWAPQYVSDALLKAEGFTEVSYLEIPAGTPVSTVLSTGQADVSMNFVGPNLIRVDHGDPVVFLAGVHVGCFEVFGGERVRKITDLKGKTVPVTVIGGVEYFFSPPSRRTSGLILARILTGS